LKIGVPYTNCPYISEVPCTREDEALAFAAGVILGGGECEVFMQNSGLGHCIDIITSLLKPYDIKINMILSVRHEPEHHAFMGRITNDLIKLLDYQTGSRENNK
jgi:sulfopyruvate decarboxylase TPP-binding subunit